MEYIKKQLDSQIQVYIKENFGKLLEDYFKEQAQTYLEETFGGQIKESIGYHIRGHFVDRIGASREIAFKKLDKNAEYIDMIEKDRLEKLKEEEKPQSEGYVERRISKDMEYGSLQGIDRNIEFEAYSPEVQMYYREKENPGSIFEMMMLEEGISKRERENHQEYLQNRRRVIPEKVNEPNSFSQTDSAPFSNYAGFPLSGSFNMSGREEPQVELGDPNCNDFQPPVMTRSNPKVQNYWQQSDLKQDGEKPMVKNNKKEHSLDSMFKDPHHTAKEEPTMESETMSPGLSIADSVKRTYDKTDDAPMRKFGVGWQEEGLELPQTSEKIPIASINAGDLRSYIREGNRWSFRKDLPLEIREPSKKSIITEKPEDLIKKGVFTEDEVKVILEASAKSRLTPEQQKVYDESMEKKEKIAINCNGYFVNDKNPYDEYVDAKLSIVRNQNSRTTIDYSLGEPCPEQDFYQPGDDSLAELITKEKSKGKKPIGSNSSSNLASSPLGQSMNFGQVNPKKDEVAEDFEMIHS